jgi:repressor of nif and glnA expression
MGFETQDIERKVLAILQVIDGSKVAVGSHVIARSLKNLGVELSERAVRYHLTLTDERGLTKLAGRRDGRVITGFGQAELSRARVNDKVGLAFSRIEMLAYRTSFDCDTCTGSVPVNLSLFNKEDFKKALKIMKPIFRAGLCVSDLVAVAQEGESLDGMVVPQGKTAFATVCSVLANGTLLKAGVPMDSRFGGILQIRDKRPMRFVELIHYAGSSLDPTEIFIRANMTSVSKVAGSGNGEILANFREIPAICRPIAEKVASKLKKAGLGGIMLMGNISEAVCEIPVDLNRVGIILIGGLNPVAAAREAGIPSDNHAMSFLAEYKSLVNISDI